MDRATLERRHPHVGIRIKIAEAMSHKRPTASVMHCYQLVCQLEQDIHRAIRYRNPKAVSPRLAEVKAKYGELAIAAIQELAEQTLPEVQHDHSQDARRSEALAGAARA